MRRQRFRMREDRLACQEPRESATFGAAAAVGLVSGLAQFVGTAGLGGRERDRTVVIAGTGAVRL